MLFLAGGVAFNVLLAGIPFILLLIAGLGFILQQSPDAAAQVVQETLSNLLPDRLVPGGSILDPVLADVVRTRTLVGAGSALAFLWFAMRLFTTLRGVLAFVFMHGRDRGYLHGKLVDLNLILLSVLLMTAWVTLSAWIVVTSGRIGTRLEAIGLLGDVKSGLELSLLRGLALLQKTTAMVAEQLNPNLHISGVVCTMTDNRNKLSRTVESEARRLLGDVVYKTTIPQNVRLAEAPAAGLPIQSYDPTSAGARAYTALAEEVDRAG